MLIIFQHCSSCSQITSTWLKSGDLSMTMVQWSSWTKSRTLLRQFWKTRIFCQNMTKYYDIWSFPYTGFVKLKSMWYSQTKHCVLFKNNKIFLLTLLVRSSSHVIQAFSWLKQLFKCKNCGSCQQMFFANLKNN